MKTLCITLFLFMAFGCSKPEQTTTDSSAAPQAPADFTSNPDTNSGQSQPTTPVVTNPPVVVPPVGDPEMVYDFDINSGATHTNELQVQLSLVAPVDIKMIKLGQKSDCSDGVPEKIKTNLVKPIFNRNSVNQFSMQFINFSNVAMACVTKNILQDDSGPEVIISQYPLAKIEEGSTAEIKYSVKDVSAIKTVNCSLNGITKPCVAGAGVVNLTAMPEGAYTFKVEATDEWGYSSAQSVAWSVISTTKQVNQVVALKDDRKVDILIVIDNSNSMEYEQKSMAKRVGNMLSVLNGLDWQIGVITTDPRNIALGDGHLLPIYGLKNQYTLNSSMSSSDAQYRLGMTLQRPEVGSSSEQSIFATYRFIERSLGSDLTYRNFFREGANFAVLVISDEDESANTAKNDPSNLIKLVSTTFKEQKVFTWHSIITKPGDTQCLKTNGAAYGTRLAQLSKLTGGLIGSVCESDYAKQVTGIANGIVNMNKSLGLTCAPLEQYPIVIKKDGVEYKKSYVKEGLNLKFNDVLPAGLYSIDYRCLK